MLESLLRPTYQNYIVNPIARCITNFSPTHITYISCLTGVVAAFCIAFHFPLLATIFLLFSGFLDTLDGTVARMYNKISEIGGVLDIISDRIVELLTILSLFAIDPVHRSGMALIMLGSCYLCITSFLVIGIFAANKSNKGFYYSSGLIERTEAFIFFILMIWGPNFFNLLAVVFSSLVLLSAYLHIKHFIIHKT